MNPRTALLISAGLMALLIIVFVVYFIFFYNSTPAPEEIINNETEETNNACLDLNCSQNTKYVGSINSDKYYACDCRYAKNINPENIVCFSSDAEAQNKNYTKIEC